MEQSLRPVCASGDGERVVVLGLWFLWLLYHRWGVALRILTDDQRFYPHLVMGIAVFFDLSCMPTNAAKSSCVGWIIGNFPKYKQNE